MKKTSEKNKHQKPSLVRKAVWLAILDAVVALSQIVILMKRQFPFTAEDYLAPVPVPLLISLLSLIALIVTAILTLLFSFGAEKEDELSTLHRYQAGYISKYICIGLIIAVIWIIKDFTFAFRTGIMDGIGLSVAILMLSCCVENIIFIILEKRNLE
ncbi:MAG: hypothetical protein IJN16_06410 [Lachnospiraceae bacterium]|nr:hypothetical protein [Lachnospiraceae bacterium]